MGANLIRFHHGDSRVVLREMIDRGEHVHACICDPPYHLESIVKRFGKEGSAAAKAGSDGRFTRQSAGFMGKQWDGADDDGVRIAFDPEFWRLCYELLLPGGFIVACGGSRTYHRMAVAIEDAGFITHPLHGWCYGQGFPKGHAVDDAEFDGWFYGTQTSKPALEPIYVGQKPFATKTGTDNMRLFGVGAFNIDACRVHGPDAQGRKYLVKRFAPGASVNKSGEWHQDVVYKGETKPGRWPANLLHDGSDAVLAAFPEAPGQLARESSSSRRKTQNVYGDMRRGSNGRAPRDDSGSAARFFNALPFGDDDRLHYCAKASRAERNGSTHPTIKPLALMRWCVRLVTPIGGTVLDPFAGSGTTGQAALDEGMHAVLVEREDEYAADIRRRFGLYEDDVLALLGHNGGPPLDPDCEALI